MGFRIETLPPHMREKVRAAMKKPAGTKGGRGRPWSAGGGPPAPAAVPTVEGGIRFPSKMEARVYRRLLAELRHGERLFCQVRLPLLCLGPGPKRRPVSAIAVDFAITRGGKLFRLIDAKCKGRVSREWKSRAAACRETWGIEIEEVES